MEFTFAKYKELIAGFTESGYKTQRVKDFIASPEEKVVILRHDVDRFPKQALAIARIEAGMRVFSTYYFRTNSSVFKENIINEIIRLGHEIGYHYDDLTAAWGNHKNAIELFKINLDKLRVFYPVETICMHGSPISPWNNTDLWKKYAYKQYGVSADLYFDLDYDSVFYITDNGFRWNHFNTSVRDKVKTEFNIVIKDTDDLIMKIKKDELPPLVLLNTHPDTFFEPGIGWYFNRFFIKSKNPVKWFIVKTGLIK